MNFARVAHVLLGYFESPKGSICVVKDGCFIGDFTERFFRSSGKVVSRVPFLHSLRDCWNSLGSPSRQGHFVWPNGSRGEIGTSFVDREQRGAKFCNNRPVCFFFRDVPQGSLRFAGTFIAVAS